MSFKKMMIKDPREFIFEKYGKQLSIPKKYRYYLLKRQRKKI